tara:strand:+ start:739 stop:954 length:216 start_codon:yes stop_codon:yes gene_type:complete
MIYKNKGEEPTAKDSKILELQAQVSQLQLKLSESKSINLELTAELKQVRAGSDPEKKSFNINLNYDGIQQY